MPSKELIEETDALMHMAKDLLEADVARVLAASRAKYPGQPPGAVAGR